jgi:PAS domain-containing protein
MTQPQDIQAQFLDGRAASALLEEAPGFIAIFHGPEHRWVFANRAFERLFPGRVVIGGTARDSFPETEWQGFLALMDRVYTTGERFVGEQVRIAFIDTDTDEGATRELFLDFVYEPIRDADGAVTGIFLDGFDVTARVRAEAQLREHETRLRAIYDGTYEYIGLLAPDGTLLEANRASLEFAGNTREEVVGRPFWETPWFAFTPGGGAGGGGRIRPLRGVAPVTDRPVAHVRHLPPPDPRRGWRDHLHRAGGARHHRARAG